MALVAYGSSGESGASDDEEETPTAILNTSKKVVNKHVENKTSDLPKSLGSASNEIDQISDEEDILPSVSSAGGLKLPPPKNDAKGNSQFTQRDAEENRIQEKLLAGLPAPSSAHKKIIDIKEEELEEEVKPKAWEKTLAEELKPVKKKRQPVMITVPSLPDDDEEKPEKKRLKPSTGKSGLFSLLPEPKNSIRKESNRPLIPYTLTKRPTPQTKTKPLIKPTSTVKSTPSEVKSTLPGIEDDDSDEDTEESISFFSLGDGDKASVQSTTEMPSYFGQNVSHSATNKNLPSNISNAPLQFEGSKDTYASQTATHVPSVAMETNVTEATVCPYPAASQNEQYQYQEQYNEEEQEPEIDPEQLLFLQGKSRHGKEEINFIDVKGQSHTDSIELTKNITEETRPTRKKNDKDLPSQQQRRKHQITYLAHQAREREFELRNQWSQNKANKKQTQSKYGF